MYMTGLVGNASNLFDAVLGEEAEEEKFEEVKLMEKVAEKGPASINSSCNTSYAVLLSPMPLTHTFALHRRHEASARLDTAFKNKILVVTPRTKWIGGANHGAMPIATEAKKLEPHDNKSMLHVLDFFSGFSCGSLRTVQEAGYVVSCYASVEIDDISRVMAKKSSVISKKSIQDSSQIGPFEDTMKGYPKILAWWVNQTWRH